MHKYLVSTCMAIVLLTYSNFQYYRDSILFIYFLNIGQGDSVLIETPDHYLILIDGGPDSTVLTELAAVLPASIKKIDMIIDTHADSDHLAGLIDVIQRYDVGRILINGSQKALQKKFLEKVDARGFPLGAVTRLSDFKFGCCIFIDFLWPEAGTVAGNENDKSISFVLSYADFAFYSGGDLSKEYEEKILLKQEQDLDLYKAGHHGSRTSTSQKVLQKFKPELVVISAAYENKFGHPHKEVVDMLGSEQIKYLRTDLQGRIKVSSDGESFWYTVEQGDAFRQ